VIFVPTHFHQLCKFLWTFPRNLWCQSFISVAYVRIQSKIKNQLRDSGWMKLSFLSHLNTQYTTHKEQTWFALQHQTHLCLCEVHIVQWSHTLTIIIISYINQSMHTNVYNTLNVSCSFISLSLSLSIQFNSIQSSTIKFKIQTSQTHIRKHRNILRSEEMRTHKHTLTDDSKWPHIGFLTVYSLCNRFRCHPTHWSYSTRSLHIYQINSFSLSMLNIQNQTTLISLIFVSIDTK
jgi:hypothetical protein